MKIFEIVAPLSKNVLSEAKTGRDIQHIEDLVFIEGSDGARRAITILKDIIQNPSGVSVKWDGTPAVVFGRLEDGTFVLTDKPGFEAKGYDGKVTSSKDLERMILSRGKEVTDDRREYAASMAKVWNVFESAVPESFRGFIHGDLLYKQRPESDNTHFVFTPNKVTYKVKKRSDLGKQIAQSSAGVVIHTFVDLNGNTRPVKISELNPGKLFIMPPTIPNTKPKVSDDVFRVIERGINKYSQEIDGFLEERRGLADLKNIIYRYVNQKVREQDLSNLGRDFINWLESSNVSLNKQGKIRDLTQEYPNALKGIFFLVNAIMDAKELIISDLEKGIQDVESYINDTPGGEGFVAPSSSTKLVPRKRFIPG